jgi:hypothetical protein
MSKPVPAYVPVMAGAIAAAAVALLVGWPGHAPLTAPAAVAASVAAGVVGVLFIVGIAVAARRPARPARVPATPTSAVRGPVADADAVTEPIEVAVVGAAATNVGSAGSSRNSSPSDAGAACCEAGSDDREGILLAAVDHGTDRKGFRKLIDERALVFTRLPPGPARDLAARDDVSVGRGDGSLHTRAEYDPLFDLLAEGAATVSQAALAPHQPVLLDKDAFFAEPMYVVEVEAWAPDAPTLQGPVTAPAGEMPAPVAALVAEPEVPAPAPEASGEALAEASSQAAEREEPSPARQQAEQPGPAPAPDARQEAETSAPAQANGRALAAPHPPDEAPTPAALGLAPTAPARVCPSAGNPGPGAAPGSRWAGSITASDHADPASRRRES